MANQNRIDEMLSKKSNADEASIFERLKSLSELEEFYTEILSDDFSEDENTLESISNNAHVIYEATLYPIVGLVACIEGFFRLKVKQLIDSSAFYKQNAKKLDVTLSLKTTIDLEINNLTIGDFVAHVVRLNNLNDIKSTFSILLDEDFIKLFSEWKDKLDTQIDLFSGTDMETTPRHKFNWLMKSLNDLYVKRNKICHESYVPVGYDFETEYLCFSRHVIEFISVCDEMLSFHVKTNSLSK
tara:strand:- start:1367 stop:2092 length:726 start_codon:yes stop_codon:yes gene_type:complete